MNITTKIYIVRHGNTFRPDETPTRVGCGTDLPLVPSGIKQAEELGNHFKEQNLKFAAVFSAPLLRTMQTAENALSIVNKNADIITSDIFTEIDYGPDENKTEEEVIARIGEESIAEWNKNGIVPDGWKVNVEDIKKQWEDFSKDILAKYEGKTVIVFTSNGIARFAPVITGNFEKFCQENEIKIKTGAYSVFSYDSNSINNNAWNMDCWNVRPCKI